MSKLTMWLQRIFENIIMVFVVVISLGPLLWVLMSSFKTNMEILGSSFSLPSSFNFKAYVRAFETTQLATFFQNSILIAIMTTFFSILIFSMAAYVLARYRFRGRDIIFLIFISALLIPVNAMLQPIYMLVQKLNLYDTRSALILVYTGTSLPIVLAIMRSFFLGIPKEIEEAAYIEGAGFMTIFFRVMLPLSLPAISSSMVIVFLLCWNEFLYALLLTSSTDVRTLPLSLRYFITQFTFDYPSLFAAIVMIVAPGILLFLVLQEQVSKGLIGGAVKG